MDKEKFEKQVNNPDLEKTTDVHVSNEEEDGERTKNNYSLPRRNLIIAALIGLISAPLYVVFQKILPRLLDPGTISIGAALWLAGMTFFLSNVLSILFPLLVVLFIFKRGKLPLVIITLLTAVMGIQVGQVLHEKQKDIERQKSATQFKKQLKFEDELRSNKIKVKEFDWKNKEGNLVGIVSFKVKEAGTYAPFVYYYPPGEDTYSYFEEGSYDRYLDLVSGEYDFEITFSNQEYAEATDNGSSDPKICLMMEWKISPGTIPTQYKNIFSPGTFIHIEINDQPEYKDSIESCGKLTGVEDMFAANFLDGSKRNWETYTNSNWPIRKSEICGVSVPIPPKEPPYFYPFDPEKQTGIGNETTSGRFWQFSDYQGYIENPPLFADIFENTVMVHYRNPDVAGSGYIAARIEIMCSENLQNYSNQDILQRLKQHLQESEIKSTNGDTGAQEIIKIGKVVEKRMWDKDVLEITFKGGLMEEKQYYLLTTNNYIYLINKQVGSSDKLVQETAEKIFTNIQTTPYE